MKRKTLWAALVCLEAASSLSRPLCYGRPQEFAAYGLWEGPTRGGLHLQSNFYLRPRLEIAAALWLDAGPKCVHGGALAGPRLIFDLASCVPALSLLGGVIGGRDVRAGVIGQFEVLYFLTPHTGLAAKAGALWIPRNDIAPQVGFGYFWRA